MEKMVSLPEDELLAALERLTDALAAGNIILSSAVWREDEHPLETFVRSMSCVTGAMSDAKAIIEENLPPRLLHDWSPIR